MIAETCQTLALHFDRASRAHAEVKIFADELNDKFSLVLEGDAALDEKMERFHNEAKGDHQLAMGLIKHSHDALKEEMAAGFNTLGDKVDGHEDRIRCLERKAA